MNIGDRLGPWRLIAELGSGGMGRVWLAARDDGEYHGQAAIKVLKRGMDSDEVLQRFRNERQILASINHPHIAQLHDGGLTPGGQPYLVMEYVRGVPVDAYCREASLDVREIVRLFIIICDAVQHAHQRLVIHRDLKPGNILVTKEGHPKLLDFGIAKLLDPEGSVLTAVQTTSASLLLTPEFASPEQIRGQPLTTASDVFSLGTLLYLLLTGQHQHHDQGTSAHELLRATCESDARAPSVIAGKHELRGDLDTIVLAALRREPERRYASAGQLGADLARWLDGQPIHARPNTFSYVAGKLLRRYAATAATAAMALIGLVVASAVAINEASIARQERARAEQRVAEVRAIANRMLSDYHDAIETLPGATPVRAKLVQDALRYLDGLGNEDLRDPLLTLELAVAYRKVAQVQSNGVNRPDLGDRNGARSNNQRALQLLEPLARMRPDDARIGLELGRTFAAQGAVYAVDGNPARAAKQFERAIVLLEPLAAKDAEAGLELARALLRFAEVMRGADTAANLGDAAHAQALLAQADARIKSLPAKMLESVDGVDLLDAWYAAAASEAFNDARYSDAYDLLAHNERNLIAALRRDPNNSVARRDLATVYGSQGAALAWLGRNSEALQAALRALPHLEELQSRDPTNSNAAADLAVGLQKAGWMQAATGEPRAGIEHLQRSRDVWLELLRRDPSAVSLRNFGETRFRTALALDRAGRTAAAIDEARAADELASKLIAANANDSNALQFRGFVQLILGRFHAVELRRAATNVLRVKHSNAARQHYSASRDVWLAMQQAGTLRPADQPRLQEALVGLKQIARLPAR